MPLPKFKRVVRSLVYLTVSVGVATAIAGCNAAQSAQNQTSSKDQDITLLPPPKEASPEVVALGRHLFFDTRLSGDWGVSCSTCHNPEQGWGDGASLSAGYSSTEYFRNAPTLLNSAYRNRFMWDGRLDGDDMGTLVRDMVTEAHTMNMDGRIAQERLKQIPQYMEMWEAAFGANDDPFGPAMFGVIGTFVKTIRSENVPFDDYKRGDETALGEEAKRGYALFKGKANCASCHNGPIGSDGEFHRLGVPENAEILSDPLRSITMLRHYATNGMPNYMNAREDVGSYAITKEIEDWGKFQTPSLRDLKYTAPYMHNGVFETLDEVIDFYNGGGGTESDLRPLQLSERERSDLKAFLLALSGDPVIVKEPELPDLAPRDFGEN